MALYVLSLKAMFPVIISICKPHHVGLHTCTPIWPAVILQPALPPNYTRTLSCLVRIQRRLQLLCHISNKSEFYFSSGHQSSTSSLVSFWSVLGANKMLKFTLKFSIFQTIVFQTTLLSPHKRLSLLTCSSHIPRQNFASLRVSKQNISQQNGLYCFITILFATEFRFSNNPTQESDYLPGSPRFNDGLQPGQCYSKVYETEALFNDPRYNDYYLAAQT